MSFQTTRRDAEHLGLPGQPARRPENVITRIAEGEIRPGAVAFRGTTGQGVTTVGAVPSADADGLIATIASSGSQQVLEAGDFDGVIGHSRLNPTRNVVLVLSSHADWDATTAVVEGENADGDVVTENLAIPNGGSATVVGTQLFSKVTKLTIPAQSGTGGTATLGTGSVTGAFSTTGLLGMIEYKAAKFPASATAEYAQYETVPIIRKGTVWAEVEQDVLDGDSVFIRVTDNGDLKVGGLRKDSDSGKAVQLEGLMYLGDSELRDGTRMAKVELNLPAA